jgi:hypothetical protein
MYLILIIGGTGQGKSPFIKSYCDGKNVFVFDVQNEYGSKTKYKNEKPYNLSTSDSNRQRFIIADELAFIKKCQSKTKTICVFEESTMFFQGAINKEMRKLIFSKAHSGNVYILVFHSINSVPPRIMEATDYVVLFKTADENKTVEKKFPRLLNSFNLLKKKKSGEYLIIKNL